MLGPQFLKDIELIVAHVQQNLKASQDKQKSYADLKNSSRVPGRQACIYKGKTQEKLPKTGHIFKIGTQVLLSI